MSSAPQKGVAPIREEFLAKKAAEPSSGAVDEDTGDSATNKRPAPDDDKGETEHPEKRRHRERGQNKHRKPYRPEAPKLKMCAAIVDGRPCPYGDGCRFSHDLAAYMQERPDDLGETCPIYTLRGHCRFGVRCRFGSCHLDATTGTNLRTEVTPAPEEEANTVSNDLINRLRKKLYDFARTDRLAQRFHDAVQSAHEQHQGKSAADAERAERGEATDSVPTSGADADAPPVDAPSADAAGEAAANLPEPPLSATAYHALAAEEILPPSHPKRKVDFRGKLYLAPLTTVGNLPFRRVCKRFGADITCGEMALATSLLQGAPSEWALLKRHPCEDVFGVQLAGNQPTAMGRVAQLIEENCDVDFVDINMGCPIDAICNKGMGSALSTRPGRVQSVVRTMSSVLSCPLTVKMRVGYEMAVEARFAHKLIPKLAAWGAQAVTLHGRSRQQRYTKQADWDYIHKCAHVAAEAAPVGAVAEAAGGEGGDRGGGCGLPLIGNGDVFSFEEVQAAMHDGPVSSVMLARGALVKPWVFTEIKERRHWDISASERLDILKEFTRFGLEHWGTDDMGVARVRKFLLEWLSFLYRYVPVGLLERLPGRLQDRPPPFVGRSDLETLMASPSSSDWVKITEMLLGPVPADFRFTPKHKANAYESGPIEAEG